MRCFTRLSVLVVLVVAVLTVTASAAIGSEVPLDPAVDGGYYISGYDASLGDVVLYVSDTTGWCINDGYLFRCSASSASGLLQLSDGSTYSVSAPAWSVPRYRNSDSSYNYTDLYISVSDSNVGIFEDFAFRYDLTVILQFISVFLLGLLCVISLVRR